MRLPLLLLCSELAAAGGDVDAATLADGAGDVGLAEDFLERDGRLVGGGATLVAVGEVEGDQIDVGIDALQ